MRPSSSLWELSPCRVNRVPHDNRSWWWLIFFVFLKVTESDDIILGFFIFCFFLGFFVWRIFGFFLLHVEDEGRVWVGELGDGGEGNADARRFAIKNEGDIKAVVVAHEVFKLMLQHDGHAFGVARLEMGRQQHAFTIGVKGDEEMLFASKTRTAHLSENIPHHTQQGAFDEELITMLIVTHEMIVARGYSLLKSL